MPDAPPRTPAECFAAILWWLSGAVAAMSGGDRLSSQQIAPIIDRLRGIKQRVADLAARIAAGTFVQRTRTAPASSPGASRPRSPGKLPRKFGWLLPLVPDAIAAHGQLEHLFRDPAMTELLAAAPMALGRPLRSLCWMLRVTPPAIIAAPKRPRPPRPPKPPRPKRAPPPRHPPIPPGAPAWMWVPPPHRTNWTFSRRRSPKTT